MKIVLNALRAQDTIMSPATTKNVTSFAMKEDATSSGYSGSSPASFGGAVTPGIHPGGSAGEILSPKKADELMALITSQTYSGIKYSAYRIAAKLDLMRSAMCLDEVRLYRRP